MNASDKPAARPETAAEQVTEQQPAPVLEEVLATAPLNRPQSRALALAASAVLVCCGMLLGLLIRIADRWEPDWSKSQAADAAFSSPPSAADRADFGRSYDRLGRALSSFPGASTEDIIKAARQAVPETAGKCAVEWHGGEAALQYGKGGGASSLALTVGHCADAVEALHAFLAGAQQKENQTQTKTAY